MKTAVTRLDPMTHRALAGLVERLLPTLAWRHNGLGLLQAYVYEGTTDELRVHVWHPSLRRAGIEHSGLIHDHRFRLTSYVLVGNVGHVEFDPTEAPNGSWQMHTVVHAREAANRHGTNDGLVAALPPRFHVTQRPRVIGAGRVYDFPKRSFHGSYVDELAVTVVVKSEQDDTPARILAPYGEEVVHAFAETLPPEAWAGPLAEAQAALSTLRVESSRP